MLSSKNYKYINKSGVETEVYSPDNPQPDVERKLEKNFDAFYSEKTDLKSNDLIALQDSESAATPKENKKARVSALALCIYPVGCIYESTDPTSPATLFGGTWENYGGGRVLVGLDSGQTDFNTVGKTGGAKTHTLTEGEMPTHNHVGTSALSVVNYGRDEYNSSADIIVPDVEKGTVTQAVQYTQTGSMTPVSSAYSPGKGGQVIAQRKTTSAYGVAASGGGLAHNNLQPYITVYRWRRTA